MTSRSSTTIIATVVAANMTRLSADIQLSHVDHFLESHALSDDHDDDRRICRGPGVESRPW